MKEFGLGTPVTRATVIETLLHRAYIERQKKLVLTHKGLATYEVVKDKPAASVTITGNGKRS